MVVDYLLVSLAVILLILGLLGCVLPVIPGPPLSWIGLIVSYYTSYGNYSTSVIVWTGVFALVATILDYIFPIWTTKKMGGTKRGVWGATVGLLLGIALFPTLGIIIGPFVGALLGEYTNKNITNPWLSATGSFIGFLLGIGLKFAVSGIITYHFVVEIFLN